VKRKAISAAVLGAALVAITVLGSMSGAGASASAARATTQNHFIANLGGSTAPRKLGYNIFDTGPTKSIVDGLPRGVRAMVWLGQKCPTSATRAFRATVRRLARDRKVFGYYLSDEPHIADCPSGPKALATRTAYIRKVSSGRQRSFIVLNQSSADWYAGHRDYRSFRPAVTGVSLVGIDSYPCNNGSCDYSKIHTKSRWAKKYIKAKKLVPVYQAFGQENTSDPYYSLPTARQERRILAAWAAEFPSPVMDLTYGWRHQSSANPTLVDSTVLQGVFRTWFGG
jgi:hypothetical protein